MTLIFYSNNIIFVIAIFAITIWVCFRKCIEILTTIIRSLITCLACKIVVQNKNDWVSKPCLLNKKKLKYVC